MKSAERGLVVLLRIGGVLTLFALLAVPLPTDWMAAIHRSLGLGELPRAPIVEYLARSLSLLYAVHGGLQLVVSSAPRRYLPIIRYLAWVNVFRGLALAVVDLRAGMPTYWTMVEGPPVCLIGLVLLWLARKLDAE